MEGEDNPIATLASAALVFASCSIGVSESNVNNISIHERRI